MSISIVLGMFMFLYAFKMVLLGMRTKIFVISFGCASSMADGNMLAGCLAEAGFEITESIDEAQVVIVNTCAVKGPTENRMISFLSKIPSDKKLIVAGCLPLINFARLQREVRFDGVVGPAFAERIADIVKRVLEGEKVIELSNALKTKPRLDLPCIRQNRFVDITPIAYGCLGECAYCCVRFARGKLRSYSIDEIVKRIKRSLDEGVREIWLCGQDTAIYGRDLGVNLPRLLREICSINSHSFLVRIGMMRPDHTLEILDELIEVYADFGGERRFSEIAEEGGHGGCLFWFLHLPVQSGDDYVLTKMRREYTVSDFKQIVEAFRRRLGESLCLATDVIVGFPGETEEAFENTLRLIKEVKPDIVNVSKFFARPGTEAEKMEPKIDNKTIKERSKIASEVALKIGLERNRNWQGWEGYVFLDKKGLKPNSQIGRNYAYKPIVIRDNDENFGRFLKIIARKAYSTYLEAIPLSS